MATKGEKPKKSVNEELKDLTHHVVKELSRISKQNKLDGKDVDFLKFCLCLVPNETKDYSKHYQSSIEYFEDENPIKLMCTPPICPT